MHATWHSYLDSVLALRPHEKLLLAKDQVPHPLEAGFYRSTGLNRKPMAHFRHVLPDGKGLHVHEYLDHYKVHWDRVDPSVDVLAHLWRDTPTLMTGLTIFLGVAVSWPLRLLW